MLTHRLDEGKESRWRVCIQSTLYICILCAQYRNFLSSYFITIIIIVVITTPEVVSAQVMRRRRSSRSSWCIRNSIMTRLAREMVIYLRFVLEMYASICFWPSARRLTNARWSIMEYDRNRRFTLIFVSPRPRERRKPRRRGVRVINAPVDDHV